MNIPLVDLKAQYAVIRPEVDAAMQRVLDTTAFILGPDVRAFEDAFARYTHAEFCIALSSGTAALELALRALDVGAGDEVVTVAHTFIATAEAISAAGATPVLVEIDARTYTMDPAALEAAITPRTRAIMPVHLYGQPADMDAIGAIARRHGIPIVEDAAQAHGALWNGRMVGTLGDVGCFSYYPGKNLGAYGDAGSATTNNPDLAQTIRLLRNHGRTEKYLHERIGFGERMDTLQAAVLNAKLPHLAAWTQARQRLAARYTLLLQDTELCLPWVHDLAEPVWHLYVVRTTRRDALQLHLRAHGIETGVHYPIPLHLQPAYAGLGKRPGSLPVTEAVASECLSLPIYPEMSEAQQDYVVDHVRAFMLGSF